MNMEQMGLYMDEIQKQEVLIAYAEQRQDWKELERLKEQLSKLMEEV